MSRLRELFTLRGTVGRSQYLATGLALAMVKYSVDAGSCLLLTGTFWDPKAYLDPTFATRMQGVDHLPAGYLAFLVLWAMPFLWIGVAMSARRENAAGGQHLVRGGNGSRALLETVGRRHRAPHPRACATPHPRAVRGRGPL